MPCFLQALSDVVCIFYTSLKNTSPRQPGSTKYTLINNMIYNMAYDLHIQKYYNLEVVMKRIQTICLSFLVLAVTPMAALATPVLQVGAPCAVPADCGTYEDYVANSTDPTETDTAITNGNTILFSGEYVKDVLKLGGQYIGAPENGLDYSGVDSNLTIFDGHDAIAVIAVPEGFLTEAMSLTLGGNGVFDYSATLSGLFPNNHDPLKDAVSDFVFIDIGNFANNAGVVPNFADESATLKDGEVKSLTLGGVHADLAWIHFDVVALQTLEKTNQAIVVTTWENNPGSKDVTWKKDGNGDGGGEEEVPEPGILALLGMGLLAGLLARRRFTNQG